MLHVSSGPISFGKFLIAVTFFDIVVTVVNFWPILSPTVVGGR